MGLLDPINNLVGGIIGDVSDLVGGLLSPLTGGKPKNYSYGDKDFEVFVIDELEGPKKSVLLHNNQLPMDNLPFGGKQRIVKDFYSGYSEPVVHVLGPQESDTTIHGKLKDKRYPKNLDGVSLEVQKLIDSIRIRGNLCRFQLGEWERYGLIEESQFRLINNNEIEYELKLNIIGFTAPINAKFLEQDRAVPFGINEALIDQATLFVANGGNIPKGINLSIAQQLNRLIGEVANAINAVTGFVDGIIKTIDDVQNSVNRALGLIRYTKNKIVGYINYVKGFNFNSATSSSISARYGASKYATAQVAGALSLLALLNSFEKRFKDIVNQRPRAKHMVVFGDTLQSIAMLYFKDSTQWKKIYDYNKLSTTELETGSQLDIPRL